MRCGSTWLYQVLESHPQIQVSEFKEVDFFFMHRMLRHDLSWYESLFRPDEGRELKPIRGEISPGYARLKAWQVNRVAKLLPQLRVLLTLRHPIERAWSQTVYSFGHLAGKDVRKVGLIEFLRQLERARSRLSSDYVRTITIWSKAFGSDALHIGFFDRLRNDPQGFIDEVLKHVGATTPWRIPQQLIKQKIWATDSLVTHERGIPDVVEWYIADRLLEPTERLNELLAGQVSHWVEEMRLIRGKTNFRRRLLSALNRTLLSLPERIAYEGYHLSYDARMWLRWQHLRRSYLHDAMRSAPMGKHSGSNCLERAN